VRVDLSYSQSVQDEVSLPIEDGESESISADVAVGAGTAIVDAALPELPKTDDMRLERLRFLPVTVMSEDFNCYFHTLKSDATNGNCWQGQKIRALKCKSSFYDVDALGCAIANQFPSGWWQKCTFLHIKHCDICAVSGSRGVDAYAMIKKQLASIGGVHWKDVRDTMQAALDGGDKVSFMDQVSMLAQFCFSWQSN
jgi:hypothetical protein